MNNQLETYILTDGLEIYATKNMTIDKADEKNAHCDVHTAGNIWWELKSKQDKFR